VSRIWRTVLLGLRSLRLHLLRSSLTVIGIMFGVSSVIAMLSVGEGASVEAQAQLKALGSTNIILQSIKPTQNQGGGDGNQRSLVYGLKYNDAEMIRSTLPGVRVTVGARDYPKELQFETRLLQGVVRGTLPWFPKVAHLKMLDGRFFSPVHEKYHSNVCVLTPELARKLFLYKRPIGKMLKIGLEPFTVIGVIESKTGVKKEGREKTRTNVNMLYVPLSASRVYFGEEIVTRQSGSFSRERVELHEIQVQVDDTPSVMPVAASIRQILKHNHREKDYEVIVPLELLKAQERTKRVFKIVLAAIAGISLVVGGIGIMNIMLASVTERTREIGIRRALGAQKRHIVLQFLVETVVLSSLGGLMGIALGLAVPWLVTFFAEMKTVVRPQFVILSYGISALVGLVFGIYPATRAAALDPIEALRHE